jgi:hypothetical protein
MGSHNPLHNQHKSNNVASHQACAFASVQARCFTKQEVMAFPENKAVPITTA